MKESAEDAKLRHKYIKSIEESLTRIQENIDAMMAYDNHTEEEDGSI